MRRTKRRNLKRLLVERLEDRFLLSGSPAPSPAWFSTYTLDSEAARSNQWIVQVDSASVQGVDSAASVPAEIGRLLPDFEVLRGLGTPGSVLLTSEIEFEHATTILHTSTHVISFEPVSAFAASNELFPNDLDPSGPQYALNNDGQVVLGLAGNPDSDIQAPAAWDRTQRFSPFASNDDSTTVGSPTISVGILDTGIDYRHEDLANNIWINQGEIPRNLLPAVSVEEAAAHPERLVDVDGDQYISFWDLNYEHPSLGQLNQGAGKITDLNANGFIDGGDLIANGGWEDNFDNDSNGFADDLIGWDFVNDDNDPIDDQGHGTAIAGVFGAVGDNGKGIAGVSWQSSMLPIKVLDRNKQGDSSLVISALNYIGMLHDNGASILATNNSYTDLAPDNFSTGVLTALLSQQQRDILYVVAAGNQGEDLDQIPYYPASYALGNVVTVAATNSQGERWRGSNFGLQTVDVQAPGVGIYTTALGNGYGYRHGTSLATPFVTGAAALLRQEYPGASHEEIANSLTTGGGPTDTASLNLLTSLEAPTFAPQANLLTENLSISEAGAPEATIEVEYTDALSVSVSDLDDNDIFIRRVGFGATQLSATLSSVDILVDGVTRTATYQLPAPGGIWDGSDIGTYEIVLRDQQIFNLRGIASQQQVLGQFEVAIEAPNVLTVNSTSDSIDQDPTTLSLREAIQLANETPGHQVILLPEGNYSLTISGDDEDEGLTGDLDVLDSLTILGAGVGETNLSAAGLDRMIDVGPGAELEITGVSISGGRAGRGGGIRSLGVLRATRLSLSNNAATQDGGAIFSQGDLTLRQSTVSGNSTTSQTGVGGGAIHSLGKLIIEDSLLANNTFAGAAVGIGGGGAIYQEADSEARILNSTFHRNESPSSDGGGIFLAQGQLQLTHVTVTENEAGRSGGGISISSICTVPTACSVLVENSIVAQNSIVDENESPGQDLSGTFQSNAGNLIGIRDGATGFEDDVGGSLLTPLNPELSDLQDLGGPTLAQVPLSGSPALNRGFSLTSHDQLGEERNHDVTLVADLEPETEFDRGLIIRSEQIEYKGEYFFSADNGATGFELWKSDGLSTGTTLVADLKLGDGRYGSSNPRDFIVYEDELYFTAESEFERRLLWKTDGTAEGTSRVGLGSGVEMAYSPNLTLLNGQLYFAASDQEGTELWTYSNTQGASQVADLRPGSSSDPSDLRAFNGRLYFTAYTDVGKQKFFVSDGTSNGTSLILEESPNEIVELGDYLYFTTSTTLWRTAGGAPRTVAGFQSASSPVVFDGEIYFLANDGFSGSEVWSTVEANSPDSVGVRLIKDINPATDFSGAPADLTHFNDQLYFYAFTPELGYELWRTDGTSEGTVNAFDLIPGPAPTSPDFNRSNLLAHEGLLYFTYDDGLWGRELWSTDGNLASRITDYEAGTEDSEFGHLFPFLDSIAINNFAYVDVEDPPTLLFDPLLNELKTSSVSLTRSKSSSPVGLQELGGNLFFSATTRETGRELWVSDGTEEGTSILREIVPGRESGLFGEPFAWNNHLYFAANDSVHGTELWVSDGSAAGTRLLKDIRPSGGSDPANFTVFNNMLYFSAMDDLHGMEIWRTDGTVAGTELFLDIHPGTASSQSTFGNISWLVHSGAMYFRADDGVSGNELWVTDGSIAGTKLVSDINPPNGGTFPPSSFVQRLTGVGTEVFFVASTPDNGNELWKTDGTSAGTSLVKDIFPGTTGSFSSSYITRDKPLAVFKDEVYFIARDEQFNYELWKSDGTLDGTQMVLDIEPGVDRAFRSFSEGYLRTLKGELFFISDAMNLPRRLWKTDGEVVELVKDVPSKPDFGGSLGTVLSVPLATSEFIYFSAQEEDGIELWRTDGTTEGTGQIADILDGTGSSYPNGFTEALGQVFLVADDGISGNELRRIARKQTAGAVENTSSEVRGVVFNDLNGDGRKGTTEPLLQGWQVYADSNNNQKLDFNESSTRTDMRGEFVLPLEGNAQHPIRLVTQSGFSSTFPNVVESAESMRSVEHFTSTALPLNSFGLPAVVGEQFAFQDELNQIYLGPDAKSLVQLNPAAAELPSFATLAPAYVFGGGLVGFVGTEDSGVQGIYTTGVNQPLTKLIDTSTVELGDLTGKSFRLSAIEESLIAFAVISPSETVESFHATAGGIPAPLVDFTTSLTNRPEVQFNYLQELELDQGSYAFVGGYEDSGEDVRGIYFRTSSFSLDELVSTRDSVPRGFHSFTDFRYLAFSEGTIGFQGVSETTGLPRHDGVYLADTQSGQLSVVADVSTMIPDGHSLFSRFGDPRENCETTCSHSLATDGPNVAFVGNGLNGQHGIYTNLSGRLTRVIDLTDAGLLGGKTPVRFALGPQAINGNRIVFTTTFDDGSEALYEANYISEQSHIVALQLGDSVDNLDFGVQAGNGEIRGVVYEDYDRDGIQDRGDNGVDGRIVFLDSNGDGILNRPNQNDVCDALSTEVCLITGDDGEFHFQNLLGAQEYRLAIVPSTDFVQTSPRGPIDLFVNAGQVATGNRFGIRDASASGGSGSNSSIRGRVLTETDGVPIADWQVVLQFDGGERTTRTDADGNYTFDNLAADSYEVHIVDQSGWDLLGPQEVTITESNTIDGLGIDFSASTLALNLDADPSGSLELVVLSRITNEVVVLRSNGQVLARHSLSTGSLPIALVQGDFNGDAFPDLAVANQGGSGTSSSQVSILLNQWDGSEFAFTESSFGAGTTTTNLKVADLDGVNGDDIVAVNLGSGDLSVALNNGQGQFGKVGDYATTSTSIPAVNRAPVSVATEDVNGDGAIDIVVGNTTAGLVSVFLQNPSAPASTRFNLFQSYSTNTGLSADESDIVLGHFNQDERIDIAVAGRNSRKLTILFNQGTFSGTQPAFAQSTTLPSQVNLDFSPTSIVTTDFDGDGDSDLAISHVGVEQNSNASENLLAILLNNGSGRFDLSKTIGGSSPIPAVLSSGMFVDDFNNDNVPDLLRANGPQNTLTILTGGRRPGGFVVSLGANEDASDYEFQVARTPPSIDPLPNLTISESNGLQEIPLTGIAASSGSGELLQVSVSTNQPNLFSELSVDYAAPSTTGVLRLSPVGRQQQDETALITVVVLDLGPDQLQNTEDDSSIQETFQITTLDIEHPPVAVEDSFVIPIDAGEVELDVLANDSDQDNDSLLLESFELRTPEAGQLRLNQDRTKLLFTPAAGFEGRAEARYVATDGQAHPGLPPSDADIVIIVGTSAWKNPRTPSMSMTTTLSRP